MAANVEVFMQACGKADFKRLYTDLIILFVQPGTALLPSVTG